MLTYSIVVIMSLHLNFLLDFFLFELLFVTFFNFISLSYVEGSAIRFVLSLFAHLEA
jgi:hypothetical protein